MFIKILWIVGGILLNFIILNISQILSKHFSDNDKYFRTPLQYFSMYAGVNTDIFQPGAHISWHILILWVHFEHH